MNSDSLIGTDYKIITKNKEYTVIVYGDVTYDGLVDAADINVITNYFLGNNIMDSQARKDAGDVFKDDKLDAADIALMKNSFLGNLKADILEENNAQSEYIDIMKYSFTDDTASYNAKIENMILNIKTHIDGNEYDDSVDENTSISITEDEIDILRKLEIVLDNDNDNNNQRLCYYLYLISNGDKILYDQNGDTSVLYNLHDQEDQNSDGIITYRESGDYWVKELLNSNTVVHEKIGIPFPKTPSGDTYYRAWIDNMNLSVIEVISGIDYVRHEKYDVLLNKETLQRIQYLLESDCDKDVLYDVLYAIARNDKILLNTDDIHYETLYNEQEDSDQDGKIKYKEHGYYLLNELEKEYKNNQNEKMSFEYSLGFDPQNIFEVDIDDKIMCVTHHTGSGYVRAHNSIEMNTVKLTDTEYEYIKEIKNAYSDNEENDVFGLCASAFYISKKDGIFSEPSDDDYEEMYDEKYDYNNDGIITYREFGDYYLSDVYANIN
jgi:hypothetical protein